jgi:hypothetical protein
LVEVFGVTPRLQTHVYRTVRHGAGLNWCRGVRRRQLFKMLEDLRSDQMSLCYPPFFSALAAYLHKTAFALEDEHLLAVINFPAAGVGWRSPIAQRHLGRVYVRGLSLRLAHSPAAQDPSNCYQPEQASRSARPREFLLDH